jgi:serine/threonine-protein kinase
MDPIPRLNAALEGRYRIERELGEGGMATVYLADDLKHERKVALKVLKPELAAVVGAERFLAEIKTTANLQHPHILPLHDSGEADGLLFYVMPYVQGESLRERLEREHQLPIDDAVRIATNMAEALDYAHSQGVIHRDIKPANVLLQAGKPVIADFGIALAVGAAGGGRLTETGLSLGTPHYMSPEQATGDQKIGPAADIYALGCVLYEMLVGEPPFTGSTAQAVLGSIITGEIPSAQAKRSTVPPNVDAVIAKALEKVPADRFASGDELRRAVDDESFGPARHSGPGSAYRRASAPAIGIGGVMIGVAVSSLFWLMSKPETELPRPAQIPTDGLADNHGAFEWFALGPAGGGVLYRSPDEPQLWYREWTDRLGVPVPGTEQLVSWAHSPDLRWLTFTARDVPGVQVMRLPDGARRTLLPRGSPGYIHDDGYVYVSRNGLARVPLEGGDLEQLTELRDGESWHGDARPLPGSRKVLFETANVGFVGESIHLLDLETKERRFLTAGAEPHYVSATGHLLYVTTAGGIAAAAFDPEAGQLLSAPVEIAQGVYWTINDPLFSVSVDGRLAYWEDPGTGPHEMVWMTRTGDVTPVEEGWAFDGGGLSTGWSVSPDGARIAFRNRVRGRLDIWVKPLNGQAAFPVTSDANPDYAPRWADSETLTFLRDRNNDGVFWDVWSVDVDVGSSGQVVFESDSIARAFWSPNKNRLILRTASRDILTVRPELDSEPTPLLRGENPAVSPDGRWLAFTSWETGSPEVYVVPFPNVEEGRRQQISIDGGFRPVWAHDGTELFYVNPQTRQLVAARVELRPQFRLLAQESLFMIPSTHVMGYRVEFFDVHPDGQRFLLVRENPRLRPRLVLIDGLHEELRRRFAADN